MSIPDQIFESSGGQESPDQIQFTIAPDTPEGVFFLSDREGVEPENYDALVKVAEKSENGATLLMSILEEAKIIESAETIAKIRSEVIANSERTEAILSTRMSAVNVSEEEEHYLDDMLQETIGWNSRINSWTSAEQRVGQAYDYYKSEYFSLHSEKSTPTIDNTKLSELYDATETSEDSTVLVVVRELRQRLPRTRIDANGRSAQSPVEKTVIEAERLARILILDQESTV